MRYLLAVGRPRSRISCKRSQDFVLFAA